jgi:predicted MFS family arabinose efflux permease
VKAILASYRELARNRALVRLLTGEFVSAIGDWLYLVALLVLVYERSNSPVLLGIVGAGRILPYVVLSVPAGIVADRYDRRLVLLVTDVARGLIMLALAATVIADGPLELIVALALLAACFSTFFGPAIGSYLPNLVKDESEFGPANSAFATLDNLAFVIGPALAGVLIATSGLALAFLLNAASFTVIALVLWRLPPSRRATRAAPGAHEPPGEGATDETAGASPAQAGPAEAPREALRRAARPLAGLLVLDVVGYFVAGGLGILTVLIAVDTLGAGEAGTGYLNAAIGIGGVVGALISGAMVVQRRLAVPLLVGAAAMGLGLVALGLVNELGPAIVTLAIAAGGSLLVDVIEATLLQRAVPDTVRGRVLGVFETVRTLAMAAGSFALPILAGAYEVGPVLVVSGAIVVVVGIGVIVLFGLGRERVAAVSPAIARVPALPVLAGLPAPRLEAAMARMREEHVLAGQVVIREGDPADRFYVIATGRFEVTQHAGASQPDMVLRELGPDDVFGEIGLLERVPRTATVTAVTDGLLVTLDGPDFLGLVGSGPSLSTRLLGLYRGGSIVSD